MNNHSLSHRLAALPSSDKSLLRLLIGAALLALGVGVGYGFLVALARAGWIEFTPGLPYSLLTGHGVSIFFYWLYLAQVALLLAFSVWQAGGGLQGRKIAWAGALLLTGGMAISEITAMVGPAILYDGTPDLVGDERAAAAWFYTGYLMLAGGLFLTAISGIKTVLASRKGGQALSSVGFALFAWAGFLMVSAIAALHAFLPAWAWALGLAEKPVDHATGWHILFHNLHYLPLMATVLIWYVLMETLIGVKSIFGQRFSKIVFSAYLVFVPPTSLYHMFLEPNLPEAVRIIGSLLSLFVSVPTLTAFLIIVATLEVHARTRGAKGLFGWMRSLPWQHPAMAASGFAVVNLFLGITFSFVLIQEKLAPLLSDTFFVPGYFHFFTVGTVSLSLLAALMVVVPALSGSKLAWPGLLRRLPQAGTLGLLAFGAGGLGAGLAGVPRRVFDVSYGGDAPVVWRSLMGLVGLGGTVMGTVLALYVAAMAVTLLAGSRQKQVVSPPVWSAVAVKPAHAWFGPVSVLALVGLMYAASAYAFEIILGLPIIAVGGGGH